jgi:dephospho-CoA kinase
MYVVALTGGIGAGKSEATKAFANLGVPIVDVDVISRQLTSAGQPLVQEIAKVFGQEFVADDGSLNRSMMREKVFTSDVERKKLEAILHPAIHIQAMRELFSNTTAPYQILAIPLFFETDRYSGVVKNTLLIDCDESIQLERTLHRPGMTPELVQGIIAAQASRSFRRALASDIIENDSSIEALIEKVNEKHKKYMQACIVSE